MPGVHIQSSSLERELWQVYLIFKLGKYTSQVHDKLLQVHALDKLKFATEILLTGPMHKPKKVIWGWPTAFEMTWPKLFPKGFYILSDSNRHIPCSLESLRK